MKILDENTEIHTSLYEDDLKNVILEINPS
jgi:hypothetical protein